MGRSRDLAEHSQPQVSDAAAQGQRERERLGRVKFLVVRLLHNPRRRRRRRRRYHPRSHGLLSRGLSARYQAPQAHRQPPLPVWTKSVTDFFLLRLCLSSPFSRLQRARTLVRTRARAAHLSFDYKNSNTGVVACVVFVVCVVCGATVGRSRGSRRTSLPKSIQRATSCSAPPKVSPGLHTADPILCPHMLSSRG